MPINPSTFSQATEDTRFSSISQAQHPLNDTPLTSPAQHIKQLAGTRDDGQLEQ
jgi:hypothetical protein